MKRLLALIAGGLGLGALLRRRSRPAAVSSSPAAELRARLDEARALEDDRAEFSSGETPVDEVPDVDGRRADVHARARQAIDELKGE